MAQSSIRLDYICRSCQYTLRRQNVILTAGSQIRNFSSTRLQNKSLATFTPTSTPELDAALNAWRTKIFLPNAVSKHHHNLIFQTKHQELLNNPPGVTATVTTFIPPHADRSKFVEEEKIKLEPIAPQDRLRIANGLKAVTDGLKKDTSAAAWDNLIPFFYGLQQAGIQIRQDWMTQLCRIANSQGAGRWTTLLEAAAQCKKTQFSLKMIDPVRELVFGTLSRAAKGGFKEAEPVATLEQIVLLMEKDEHCNGKILQHQKGHREIYADMRKDPMLLATRLAFRSAAALLETGGRDTTGVVAGDVAKLIAFNESTPRGLVGFAEKAYFTPEKEMTDDASLQIRLQDLTMVYCGLALASKVDLKATLSKEQNNKTTVELQKMLQAIKPKLTDARQAVEKYDAKRAEKGVLSKKSRSIGLFLNVEQALQSF